MGSGQLHPRENEQSVRYYGVYSNASRGKKEKAKVEEEPTEVTEVPSPPVSQGLKRRRSTKQTRLSYRVNTASVPYGDPHRAAVFHSEENPDQPGVLKFNSSVVLSNLEPLTAPTSL
jgi:hypothetical protein